MEGELIPADVVIDAMTLWSREVEDHPSLTVLFRHHSQTRGPQVLKGKWAQNPTRVHLFSEFHSAEARL